jgi:8-oxo-dGTP diphosphatase
VHVPCVGAVILESGRLLLVQRGHPPAAGRWSLPGGRVEPGESDAEAIRREVREETRLEVDVRSVLGRVELPGRHPGEIYDVRDHACRIVSGTPIAGDDAASLRWVTAAELLELERGGLLTDGLVGFLTEWGVVPD